MKIKISLELDVTGTLYEIKNKKRVEAVLSNIAQLFQEFQNNQYIRKTDILSSEYSSEAMKKALLKNCDEHIQILSTMFHNWTVEGEMKDGNRFKFTHTEPNYQEELKFF